MRFAHLTAETELQVHLGQAQAYWRADRLDLAQAAIHAALRVGVEPGAWYDFQRTIEAEAAARAAGDRIRTEEHLILEADPDRWGAYWPEVRRRSARAMHYVAEALDIVWGLPVLLTLMPDEGWVEFMRARYGYYQTRSEVHKVCLPPSAVYPGEQLRRAARHEITHAAVRELAGDAAPPWLNEGMAVVLEGDTGMPDQRRLRIAAHRGSRLRLDEISAGFTSVETDIGGSWSALCYAAAGDFVGRLVGRGGLDTMRGLLRALGRGRRIERAFRDAFDEPLARAESRWQADLRAAPPA